MNGGADDDDSTRGEEWQERPRRRRPPPPRNPLDEPGMHYVLPVNTSGLAIAAGYLGLISVLCLPAPLALLLGILAMRDLRRNPKLHGRGRAIFGIVMGTLFTGVLMLILVAAIFAKK